MAAFTGRLPKLGELPGSWRVRHDRIPPELTKALYAEAKVLATEDPSPVRVARRLSTSYSLSLSPGTVRHWMVGDREPGVEVRNNFEEKPSPALSYIIGANKGDGCILAKSAMVKLEVTDMDFAETFNSRMAELFSRDKPNRILVRTFEKPRLPLLVVKYRSRKLVNLLQEPVEKLTKLASAFPREFLRGFFDAEGFVEVTAHDTFDVRVGAENSSRILLSSARYMLNAFGIHPILRRKRESGTPKTIRGELFLTRRASFLLLICRQSDIRRFEERIGFSISRKQKKLEDALETLEIKDKSCRSTAWKQIYTKDGGEWVRV